MDGFDVRSQALEGERLGLGEVEDSRLLVGPELDLLVQAAGVFGFGSDDQDRDFEGFP